MLKLLLIDDEPMVLRLFKEVLEISEFEVHTANCARDGIRALEREAFDVVVTDLRMETPLAGYDVVKAAQQSSARPLVAVVTAFPVPASDWKRAGADALFVKGSSGAINLGREIQQLWRQHFGVTRSLAAEKRA